MGLFKRFLGQTRKPEGFFGKLMLNAMNQGHAALSDWGLSHIEGLSPLVIAELGCGGGRNSPCAAPAPILNPTLCAGAAAS